MTPWKVTLIVLLGGCGAPVVQRSDCLQFGSNAGLNQAALDANLAAARRALAKLVPESDFCRAFSTVEFTVRDEVNWQADDGGTVRGNTFARSLDPAGDIVLGLGIELGSDLHSLAHELIHAWDTEHDINRADHAHWAKTGRYLATKDYETHLVPMH